MKHNAIRAARAAANPSVGLPHRSGNPATDLTRRIPAPKPVPGRAIRRGRRASADKGRGMWRTVKPSYRTMVTVDARWSA